MKKLLYEKIAENIMMDIISFKIPPGSKIDSVREISMKLVVNPKTVQKAFEYLEDKGIFISVVGSGRYVTEDEEVLKKIRNTIVDNEIKVLYTKLLDLGINKKEIIKLMEERITNERINKSK